MILVIDNYDSFTHNLVHLIGPMGHDVRVARNDTLSAQEAVNSGAKAIVISPGPCTPNEAGICLELVQIAAEAKMPVFGVCLGLQSIAQSFGAKIVRAQKLMHGKTCAISHNDSGAFAGLPDGFTATRYHSLVVEPSTVPNCFSVTARAENDDEIMGLKHNSLPIEGVQFHPESIATEFGAQMLTNFFDQANIAS